ncbi:hypothetical protein D3C87_1806650 [compost metagenome]
MRHIRHELAAGLFQILLLRNILQNRNRPRNPSAFPSVNRREGNPHNVRIFPAHW